MAISHRASGSWAYASSGSVTPTLPTHSAGDMLLARVAYKSSNLANCVASCATSGWAKVGEKVGTGNSGNGTGGVNVATFWKVATSGSETNPTIDFSQTVTQVGHVAISYQKGASESWSTPVGDGGEDTTADTSKSCTIASHVSVTSGDMVDFFYGVRDDCTCTVPTITQTGVTFGTVSEQPATAGTDTSGADGAYDGGYRLASSGTSSAAAVITGTLNTSETATGWQTRLRVFTPETHDGSFTTTGGGVTTGSAGKGGLVGTGTTGGGAVATSSIRDAGSAVTSTGGGSVTAPALKDGQGAPSSTGGGVVTWDADAESGEEHDGSFAATGGGAATIAPSTERSGSVTPTGGGAVASSALAARSAGVSGTGGGAVGAGGAKQGLVALDSTGSGVTEADGTTTRLIGASVAGSGTASIGEETARSSGLGSVGGGVVEVTGTQESVEEAWGDFTLTGGGAADIAGRKSVTPADASGGDLRFVVAAPRRQGSFGIGGRGHVRIEGRGEWFDDDLILDLLERAA